MLSWFRIKPKPLPANPGQGHLLRTAFSNVERTWEESVDLVTCMRDVLTSLGYACSTKRGWVELPNGLTVLPQVVSIQPLDDGGVRTISTVQTSHKLLVPNGVFEYQHATGRDLKGSFISGFKDWAQLDLPVFLDALRSDPETCMLLSFSKAKAQQHRHRRVVLGPTSHAVQQRQKDEEEHPFCPCCIFTSCYAAFEDLLAADYFCAIRLFVLRNAKGEIEADCRVNGEDWPAGKDALLKYGQEWPHRGFESRKQYVAIQVTP
ncbi:MAG TPA: DUF6348 family protein [Gammaproteobacteria bacterium]